MKSEITHRGHKSPSKACFWASRQRPRSSTSSSASCGKSSSQPNAFRNFSNKLQKPRRSPNQSLRELENHLKDLLSLRAAVLKELVLHRETSKKEPRHLRGLVPKDPPGLAGGVAEVEVPPEARQLRGGAAGAAEAAVAQIAPHLSSHL